MLKLIYGASGSGKTTHLIGQIQADIKNQKRCYLLVPEQQAYISERDFAASLPQNAGLFFEVVNFSRLAEDVFREYGGVTQGSINNGLRTLLMWDTLRTSAPLFQQYGKSASADTTLTSLMLKTVSELRSNGVKGERLEEIEAALPKETSLAKKLSDLSLIDAQYRERCEACFGSDPADKLLRMAKLLREHRYFENASLYIDSFTSFTAQEYEVLREILRQADTVTVSLCMDDLFTKLPHFESTVRTAQRLIHLANEADSPIFYQKMSQSTEKKPRALEIVEKNLWRFELTKDARETLTENEQRAVRTIVCPNLYEEAEMAALNILDLVQGGMKFGDVAIVVRDTEDYRGVLDAAMEKYGIPYFLSERTDLSVKPLSRLILSALRAVSRHYQAQDIMTLIKTGLVGVTLADGAMFEEYCETWHISGSRFTDETWSMNPDGLTTERSARAEVILDAANRVRHAVISPLQAFSSALRASHRMIDRCQALYAYLCKINVSKNLSDRAATELADGRTREASETVRLYQFVTDTLSTLCEVMPDAELTVDEFITALTLLFSETDLGSVPDLHDCVMIGSAATMRVENIKAALLLGLCEGDFPKAVTDDGILSEADKLRLEEFGIQLDSSEGLRSSEELLYVYRAMTKPTERLYLSTVSAQPDGSARTPSLAFSRVRFLLNAPLEEFDSDEIRRVLDEMPTWKEPPLLVAQKSADGTTLRLSQSKIQTFVLCPYRYYSTYQLKLREKKDSRPSYADDGLFLHFVFEKFLRNALQPDGKLQIPDAKEIEPLADAIIDEYLQSVCPLPPEHMDRRLLHLFARLRRLSVIMLRDILAELAISGFVPYRFEQIIGMPQEGGLPAMVLELKNGSRVSLSGKVDRIDLYDCDGKLYVRVVDYKSGEHKFKLEDVRSGMDVQLVLYLFSVLAADPQSFSAAGAQYLYATTEKGKIGVSRSGFLLDDPKVRLAADGSTEEKPYTKKLLLQSAEEINALADDMRQAVTSVAERILSGEATKTPSEDACRFCPIRTHCDRAYHD